MKQSEYSTKNGPVGSDFVICGRFKRQYVKKAFLIVLPFLIVGLGCRDDAPATESEANTSDLSTRDTCQLAGIENILEGNRYTDFLAEEKVVLRDPGENNWRLEVYDLFTCEMKAAYQLPRTEPTDFPFFLADLTYNNAQRQVGIRGYREFFIVDLQEQRISEAIAPAFPEGRLTDVESGQIQHLEVWENYLVGSTVDWGSFVFRLDADKLMAVLPSADYRVGEEYRSLFLIETNSGQYQAIIPQYDYSAGLFRVDPIFSQPIALDPSETVYASGSPYARLLNADGTYTGIDLRTGKLLPVIEEREPN